jgi:membrane associated rhomboid family serine protease
MSDEPLQARYTRREVLLDLAGLVAVAAALATIHFLLSESTRAALSFEYGAVEPWMPFTAGFVHASTSHLSGNVLGYLMTVLYAYTLALHSDSLAWFRRTTIAVIVAIPPLVTLANWAYFSYQGLDPGLLSRGFSGAVAGFGGVLLFALYLFVRDRYNHDLAYGVGFVVLLTLAVLVDVRFGGVNPLLLALGAVGIALTLGGYAYEHGIGIEGEDAEKSAAAAAGVVVFVGVVLVVLFLGLFPASNELVSGGTLTNVFAHFIGFVLGLIASISAYWCEKVLNISTTASLP